MGGNLVLDPELCQAALQQVVESHAFARSEQSKNFLKYVCAKTIAGQAADIKEYSIGVEALGRPSTYSPADDSSVRRRAYELRQRLDEFYAAEMPEARVRIELPKGSYVPLFVEWEPAPVPPQADADEIKEVILPAPSAGSRVRTLLVLALGGLLGAGIVLGVRGWSLAGHPAIDPIVQEFWGPLVVPQSRTLICLGNNLHMVVRAAPFADNTGTTSYPAPAELYATFTQHRPLPPGVRLFMRPADNVAPIGVISGIAAVAGTLRLAGATYQIFPERSAPLASFRGRNVILFGDALTSQAAAIELRRAYLTIGYDDSGTRLAIRDRRKPATDPPVFSRKRESSSGSLEVYGLITVLPTEGGNATQNRTFIISGVSNAGIHGAMEFLAAPEGLRSLKARFTRQGLQGIPPAYQVVVKSTADSTLLLSYEYAAHEVIDDRVAAALK